MKYSALIMDWLGELGYTHCFFVPGGHIMHLIDAVRTRFICVPFVHEVGAAFAAESFNEMGIEGGDRAFALVTAGPGVTNVLTAMAQAWLESRELLVVTGQVKSSDVARSPLRQRGIQEIDGVALAKSISVVAEQISKPIDRATFTAWVERGRQPRKGPVFIEICLDAQAATVDPAGLERRALTPHAETGRLSSGAASAGVAAEWTRSAQRPVLLIGGGVSRATAAELRSRLTTVDIAVATTWNGMDRVDADDYNYIGRPNTWGQRSSNVLLQQADVIVAVGTRLGLQQTGFNWQQFGLLARVVQVEIDAAELEKGHPRVDLAVNADANAFLRAYLSEDLGEHSAWLAFCRHVREELPLAEPSNETASGYLDPYRFTMDIGKLCSADDIVVPCSSGGAFTVPLQAFPQRFGQRISTAKGLAAMGAGLSSAIGASMAFPLRRTILFDGDGGFSQNLQELATVEINRLNLKILLMSNEGYASIRMTQKNYFNGDYLGCDVESGLGFPRWPQLFAAYGIPVHTLEVGSIEEPKFLNLFASHGPAAFVVPIDPAQTYYPKITSRVTADGSMESNPLHRMTPELSGDVERDVLRYLVASKSLIAP